MVEKAQLTPLHRDKPSHASKAGNVWKQLHCADVRSEFMKIDNKHRSSFYNYIETEAHRKLTVQTPKLLKPVRQASLLRKGMRLLSGWL